MFLRHFKAPIGWAIFILVLNLIPGQYFPEIPTLLDLLQPDKLIHLFLFGSLSFLLIGSLMRQYGYPFFRYYGIIIVLSFCVGFGAMTEIMQVIIALNRSGNIYDFIANSAGSFIGIGVYMIVKRKKLVLFNANMKKNNTLALFL